MWRIHKSDAVIVRGSVTKALTFQSSSGAWNQSNSADWSSKPHYLPGNNASGSRFVVFRCAFVPGDFTHILQGFFADLRYTIALPSAFWTGPRLLLTTRLCHPPSWQQERAMAFCLPHSQWINPKHKGKYHTDIYPITTKTNPHKNRTHLMGHIAGVLQLTWRHCDGLKAPQDFNSTETACSAYKTKQRPFCCREHWVLSTVSRGELPTACCSTCCLLM